MKVSVVIPTHNDEGTIAQTLESVFAQQVEGGFEVIVVNDGSTDGTRAVVEKFDARTRVIDQKNRGVAAARNAGISAAAGEYIALLDADDTWTGQILQKTVALLDKNPQCVAVFSDGMEVDGAGGVVNPNYVEPGCDHSPTLDEMLGGRPWPILVGSIVIRRDTLRAIGGFCEDFKAEQWGGEDTYLFLLVRERGQFVYLPEVLVRHRRREFRAHYASRLHRRIEINSAESFSNLERRFAGHLVLARLAREHFGARGNKIAEWAIDRTANELVTVGLMAMHDGNPGFARRCYRASIRYRPRMLKTYLRFAWAMLPAKISQALSPMLAPGMRRSLSGPPFSIMQDRAQ
ncbi:glycosyltransferase family 2 protein [Candidatus Binatus sp.]|uniref:glycosyltransferase family 2 protein n=1 Tax=Candidatus Binatus sp. TaxID=2811406 RepID=UPI003C478EA7